MQNTFTINNKQYFIEGDIEDNIWWIDNDMYIRSTEGVICCKNAYPTSVEFGELDYSADENCIIITKRYEK